LRLAICRRTAGG